jgi:hypothetical protein
MGVLRNSTKFPTLGELNCSAAQPGFPILQFLAPNASEQGLLTVTAAGECITVSGDAYGLLAAKDYFLLATHGVIPNG